MAAHNGMYQGKIIYWPGDIIKVPGRAGSKDDLFTVAKEAYDGDTDFDTHLYVEFVDSKDNPGEDGLNWITRTQDLRDKDKYLIKRGLEVGDKVIAHKPSDLEEHPTWVSSMNKYNRQELFIEEFKDAGYDGLDKCPYAQGFYWNPYWLEKVVQKVDTPVVKKASGASISCPREGCPNFAGTDQMASNTYGPTDPCPVCGFPGLIPKAGWCLHRNLRTGYDGKIYCIADGCQATFKLSRELSQTDIKLTPNVRLARYEQYSRSAPNTLKTNDFLCLIGLNELKYSDTEKSKVLVLSPDNSEAVAPSGGWKWPKR